MLSNTSMIKKLIESKKELDHERSKRQRAQALYNSFYEEHQSLDQKLKDVLGEDNIVYKNAINLSKTVANIQLAIQSTTDVGLREQYFATLRRLISVMNKNVDIFQLAFVIEHSNIIKKAGLRLNVSGIDAFLLLLKGYALIDTNTDAKVKMQGMDILYRYPSVGKMNKKPRSFKDEIVFNDFMKREFELDIDRRDQLNSNKSEMIDIVKKLKETKTENIVLSMTTKGYTHYLKLHDSTLLLLSLKDNNDNVSKVYVKDGVVKADNGNETIDFKVSHKTVLELLSAICNNPVNLKYF